MGRGWADIYTYKVLKSKSAMKKILLQIAFLLVTFAANAELTEWKNIVSTNFVTIVFLMTELLCKLRSSISAETILESM